MVGTRDAPHLHPEAMETLGVALCLTDALPRRLHRLGPDGPQLVEANDVLLRFLHSWNSGMAGRVGTMKSLILSRSEPR